MKEITKKTTGKKLQPKKKLVAQPKKKIVAQPKKRLGTANLQKKEQLQRKNLMNRSAKIDSQARKVEKKVKKTKTFDNLSSKEKQLISYKHLDDKLKKKVIETGRLMPRSNAYAGKTGKYKGKI